VDLGMLDSEMLYTIASNHWSEYFIGIAKDQNEVLRAKSKFATLDPQNASSFWGDIMKLVPHIQNRSIDNFFIVLPENTVSSNTIQSLKVLLSILKVKLTSDRGTVQILTDMNVDIETFKELESNLTSSSFQFSKIDKVYFPKAQKDGSLLNENNTRVLALRSAKGA
jgi:DNA-directed RNA polymerase subunit F